MSRLISLSDLLFALVSTLDLVGDDDGHGKRVAQMAYQVGKHFGFAEDDLEELFLAGLLHDLGVSSTYVHSHLVETLEWEGVKDHCETGAEMAGSANSLEHLRPYILHHHDRWPALQEAVGKQQLTEKQAVFANIILLVDRIDAMVWTAMQEKGYDHYYLARDDALKQLDAVWSEFFREDIYQAFLRASEADTFWMMNDKYELIDFVKERLGRIETFIDMDELIKISKIFANAVDAKSSYTYQHSRGVAALAEYLARQCELSEETQQRIYIAGLLHDLGKLDMDDEILEKEAPLDYADRQQMNRHSFISYAILKNIRGMEDIALWASQHHEKLNGSGYPGRTVDMPTESRILAVADIFQALAQDRPYRKGLSIPEIMSIIRDMTDRGELDSAIVSCVERHQQEAYKVSLLQ